jgi:hypothetical protein
LSLRDINSLTGIVMVGFFDSLLSSTSDDEDSSLTSTSGIYSVPNGTNPIVPNMVPGGGAFTLGQWGNMYQARADIAQSQGWMPDNDNGASAGYSLLSDKADDAGAVNNDSGEAGNNPQLAQMFPFELFAKPPVEIIPKPPTEIIPKTPVEPVKPPLPDYPADPSKSPGEGWEWHGRPDSTPGDGKGGWFKPDTGESLYPHFDGAAHDPHWDFKLRKPSPEYPNPDGYRWYRDRTMEPKTILPPDYA